MEIIDAWWEKRNLGFRVCEIIFDQNDLIDFTEIADLEQTYEYLVAKIPVESVHLVHELENNGFRYLENQQLIYFTSEQFLNLNKNWERRFQNIVFEEISEKKDLKIICDKIMEGLYKKGRISADPDIEKGISDLRIVNWLKDLYNKDTAAIYGLSNDGTIIGYFALDKLNNFHLNVVQAAIFTEYQNKGYSFLLPYSVLKIAYSKKFKGVFASISTGNMKTLNSISKFVHFSVKQTSVVLRKSTLRKPDSFS
jgi:hypothetical protein